MTDAIWCINNPYSFNGQMELWPNAPDSNLISSKQRKADDRKDSSSSTTSSSSSVGTVVSEWLASVNPPQAPQSEASDTSDILGHIPALSVDLMMDDDGLETETNNNSFEYLVSPQPTYLLSSPRVDTRPQSPASNAPKSPSAHAPVAAPAPVPKEAPMFTIKSSFTFGANTIKSYEVEEAYEDDETDDFARKHRDDHSDDDDDDDEDEGEAVRVEDLQELNLRRKSSVAPQGFLHHKATPTVTSPKDLGRKKSLAAPFFTSASAQHLGSPTTAIGSFSLGDVRSQSMPAIMGAKIPVPPAAVATSSQNNLVKQSSSVTTTTTTATTPAMSSASSVVTAAPVTAPLPEPEKKIVYIPIPVPVMVPTPTPGSSAAPHPPTALTMWPPTMNMPAPMNSMNLSNLLPTPTTTTTTTTTTKTSSGQFQHPISTQSASSVFPNTHHQAKPKPLATFHASSSAPSMSSSSAPNASQHPAFSDPAYQLAMLTAAAAAAHGLGPSRIPVPPPQLPGVAAPQAHRAGNNQPPALLQQLHPNFRKTAPAPAPNANIHQPSFEDASKAVKVVAPSIQTSLQILEGSACEHFTQWKRLRVKKGIGHFLCRQCGAKWKTPSTFTSGTTATGNPATSPTTTFTSPPIFTATAPTSVPPMLGLPHSMMMVGPNTLPLFGRLN